jgi:predicted nuclease with TOPRIM domain
MSVDAEVKTIFQNYFKLLERVKKLIILVNKLAEQNRNLKQQIKQQDEKLILENKNRETLELKDQLKKLRTENKILKEKETKIRTKIERLTVKLNNIH